MAVFNVSAFRDLATFKKEVTDFAHYLKATPPKAVGFTEVFYPGEVEFNKGAGPPQERRADRRRHLETVGDLAATYGIADKLGFLNGIE